MIKFLGFKASLNFGSAKSRHEYEDYPIATGNGTAGAYRPKREEFFGNGSLSESSKKIIPSMVVLPQSRDQQRTTAQKDIKLSKSTGNLAQPPQKVPQLHPPPSNNPPQNIPVNLRKSAPNVSQDPRGRASNNSVSNAIKTEPTINDQKILKQHQKMIAANDKQARKLLEQEKKKQKKLATEQEKLKKEKEKTEKKRQQEKDKRSKKNKTPPLAPLQPPLPTQQPPLPLRQAQSSYHQLPSSQLPSRKPDPPELLDHANLPQIYSTNTLDSSISRSSEPPPYSDTPGNIVVRPNKGDDTGNTSFGKRIEETGSWDLVNLHRQQMAAPTRATEPRPKQKVMDLKYDVGKIQGEVENSEA